MESTKETDSTTPANEETDADLQIEVLEPTDGEESGAVTEQEEKAAIEFAQSMVDFSGQGLTLVPTSLFKRTEIVNLNLSSNNIRSIPSDIGHLSLLTKIDLSRNGLRCQNAADYTTLPMEMTQLEFLTELNLSECNLTFIPATVWLLANLQILNLSRNKVRELPKDIGNLGELVFLNAQQMGLTTLPEAIVCCEKLKTILLYGNDIDKLPESLRDCLELEVLRVNFRHFCVTLDNVMESMLKKGQIRSEHLPPVLFDIPSIKKLHLEHCMLNDLPESINENLVEAGLSDNYFTFVPSALVKLQHLRHLNLARNMITELPAEFGQLVTLQWLNLRENSLTEIFPQVASLTNLEYLNVGMNQILNLSPEIGRLTQLKELLLDNNSIKELPEEICTLVGLETLDLSENQLTELPLRLHQLENILGAHCFEGLFRKGLWLLGNPLTVPSPEVWRCSDHEKIWTHLKKLEIRRVSNLSPLKVVTVGNYQCGKTSFLSTLSTGRFQATTAITGTTKAFDMNNWTTENTISFVLTDVGAHKMYETLWPRMLDNGALFLVAFDVYEYWSTGNFDGLIGHWLALIYRQCPGAVVRLIGLKTDLLEEKLNQILQAKMEEEMENEKENEPVEIDPGQEAAKVPEEEAEIPEIPREGTKSVRESTRGTPRTSHTSRTRTPRTPRTPRSAALIDALAQMDDQVNQEVEQFLRYIQSYELQENHSKSNKKSKKSKKPQLGLRVLPEVRWFTVMLDVTEAYTAFINELELTAINLDLFPNNQTLIPKHWSGLAAALKRAEELIMEVEEIIAIGKNLPTPMDKQETLQCLKNLHLTGNIFWQSSDIVLKKYVFTKINLLRGKLGRLLRVDLEGEALNYDENLLFKCRGNISKEEFVHMRQMLLEKGQFSYTAINCLMMTIESEPGDMALFQELAELFQVGYSLTLPHIPQGKLHFLPILVMPALVIEAPPENFFIEEWPIPFNPEMFLFEKVTYCTFPMSKPLGLFESLSVCVHEHVDGRMDFAGLVLAWRGSEELLLEEREGERGEYGVQCSVRRRRSPEDEEDISQNSILHTWFLKYMKKFRKLHPGGLLHMVSSEH